MYPIPSTKGDNWESNLWKLPSSTLQEGPPATNTPSRRNYPQDQLQHSISFNTRPNPGPADISRKRQVRQIRVRSWTSDQDKKSGSLFQALE